MKKLDEIIRKIVIILLKIIHKDHKPELVDSMTQFVKFGLVGVTNTLIGYGINVLVLKLLQPYNLQWDYVAGNVVSFILSVLWSFYWNNKFVFTKQEGQQRNIWQALLKTYVAYGFTGIILTNILSYLWIDVLGVSKYIAPLINLVISVPLNFIINKLWAFRTKPTRNENTKV